MNTAVRRQREGEQVSVGLVATTGMSGWLEVEEDASLNHPQPRESSGDYSTTQASCSTLKSNTAPGSIGRQFLGYLRVGKQLPADEVDTTTGQTEGSNEAAIAPAKGNISIGKSDYLAEHVTDGSDASGLPVHGFHIPRWDVGIEIRRPRDGEDGAGLWQGHHDDPKPLCDAGT